MIAGKDVKSIPIRWAPTLVSTFWRFCTDNTDNTANMGSLGPLPIDYTESMGEMDIIFAGGGTAACVAAGRLAKADPDLKILLVEGGPNQYHVSRSQRSNRQMLTLDPGPASHKPCHISQQSCTRQQERSFLQGTEVRVSQWP